MKMQTAVQFYLQSFLGQEIAKWPFYGRLVELLYHLSNPLKVEYLAQGYLYAFTPFLLAIRQHIIVLLNTAVSSD